MGYLPVDYQAELAVKDVSFMYRNNKYKYSYCVSTIAKRYGLSFSYLMSQCGKNNKHYSTVTVQKKKTPEEAYNGKVPYWVEK